MISYILVIWFISLFISIPGFLMKSGISIYKSIIPIYNLYYLSKCLEIPLFLFIFFIISLIIFPYRAFILTLIFILLAFMLSDAYGKGKIYGLLILLFPIVMMPLLAYLLGTYMYEG